MRFSAVLLLLLVFLASNAVAADRYVFDKDHTHILFFIDHLGFSKMIGRAREFDGYFTFDESKPEESVVDVTVKSAGMATDVQLLDKILGSEKFFNTKQFPEIYFKSTGVKVISRKNNVIASDVEPKNTGDVVGELTMLGVTRPVTLHVVFNKSGLDAYSNNYTAGFSADMDIKRSDFGMKAYIPDVGDLVHIHIETEASDPLRHPGNVKVIH